MWRTALGTDLPAERLAGAGAFAHARALDPGTWVGLAARTAATTLPDASPVNAARAAENPDSSAAFALLTALLKGVHATHWHTERVRDHARALLAADTPTCLSEPTGRCCGTRSSTAGFVDLQEQRLSIGSGVGW
ncbi:hypothetical protein ACIBSV_36315 [Embleya sp. NPDC050154]|uniref:hypothetical protein n=1 Tax=Embleya sp. NPDC050154 TaxID=3363988 RepID=UPI0037AD4BA9